MAPPELKSVGQPAFNQCPELLVHNKAVHISLNKMEKCRAFNDIFHFTHRQNHHDRRIFLPLTLQTRKSQVTTCCARRDYNS
ncbi:Myelin regulatory factor [Trichinella pseudospiralis]